ncbi:DEKNAAC102864 [Brettanomyces naardenensis]|uniref:DEKNAAC102864 n=1 Tax=Brettanomyces naardenensis TaxID=13370 RepID=A0A448YLV7_BRENA|nr:DEKNAAC102864 [Brettanomyces naardenensis]
MKCLFLLISLLVGFCSALKVTDGDIKLDGKSYGLQGQPIPLDVVDRELNVSFKLVNDDGSSIELPGPRQVSVVLYSEALNAQSYFYPHHEEDAGVYNLDLSIRDISAYLRKQDSIVLKVLVGDSDASNNLIETIGELEPTRKLQEDINVELPERFGPKDEIHHVFGEDSKQAPGVVSRFFVMDVFVVFAALIFFWVYGKAINVENATKVTPVSYLFIGSLVGFEAIFYSYYMGTSIFTTLSRVVVLGLVGVYLGSKVLRSLWETRN